MYVICLSVALLLLFVTWANKSLSSPQQRQKTTGNASPKDFPSSLQPTPIIPLNREGEEGIWIVAINYVEKQGGGGSGY